MGLKVLQCVLVGDTRIVGVNLCLAYLGTFLKTVEYGNAERNAKSVGVIPMIALAGMEPVLKLVGISSKGKVAGKGDSGQIGILGQFHLLLGKFLLRTHELQFIQVDIKSRLDRHIDVVHLLHIYNNILVGRIVHGIL